MNVDDAGTELLGIISVSIVIGDENEAPVIDAIAGTAWVYETAQNGDSVVEKPAAQTGPGPDDLPISIAATDPEGGDITFSIVSAAKVPFAIDSSTGALTVELALGEELDHETTGSFTFMVQASDGVNNPTMEVEGCHNRRQ